jgi:hypothetical protein
MGAPAESVDVAWLRWGGFSAWEDRADHFFTAEEIRFGTNGVASGAPAASSARSRNNNRSASACPSERQVSGHPVIDSATTAGDQLVIDGAGEARSLRPSFLAIQSSAFPRKSTPVTESAGIITSAVPAG